MTVNNKEKKQYARWLQIVVITLVVVALVLIFKNKHSIEPKMHKSKGELKMKANASYKEVKGILHISHWVTEHGVPVYFVRVPTLPMVDIEIVFDAGSARNGEKGGLAYLTNLLLAEGTAHLSADQVAENFDNVGAQYNAESQRDMALVHLRSLSEKTQLQPAVENLAAILTQPHFPENGLKRLQQNALSTLKYQAQKPGQVASRAFFSLLYPHQPYANWVLGDEKSIQAITVADVKAFYQQYYVAKNAVVTIVGDLTLPEADEIAQSLTNALPTGEKPAPLPVVADVKEKVIKRINFPAAQTTILIGEPGLKQNDPDYYALYVGNHILGGNGSVTRIFNTVRNQHGLAYSAYSYFTAMRDRGPFMMGCQTRNDQAEKASEMMQALLKEFVAKGPTEQELVQAKQNLLGGYALQFDSNSAICHQVATLGFYDLPLDYLNQFKPAVEKLTVADIQHAFQKRISPDHTVVVMVGGQQG